MIKEVVGLYFSPLGGTAKVTKKIAMDLADRLNEECAGGDIDCRVIDLLKDTSGERLSFGDETIVVVGIPAYVGRLPHDYLNVVRALTGDNTMTVPVVSYGNRSYGNSLYELNNILEQRGFSGVGAAALVVKHRGGAYPRPDAFDFEELHRFGDALANKVKRLAGCDVEPLKIRPVPLQIRGRMPIHYKVHCPTRVYKTTQAVAETVSRRRNELEWFL